MSRQFDHFLKSVQNRAYAQAECAVGDRDEALDIVQDSMMKLAKKYMDKPEAEWPMLFQRILQNKIRDWYRKQKVRRIIFWWEQYQSDDQSVPELLGTERSSPTEEVLSDQALDRLDAEVKSLPLRQQQVFMLRAFWGHSIEETAGILDCTVGTVKTHYSRAINTLRSNMESN
ncbi:MAG: RNA polymerase sigma factor [Halioglobus sp.]